MQNYIQDKPWFVVKYTSVERKTLMDKFHISVIPTLVILDSDGNFITDWGKSAVSKNGDHCIEEWKQRSPGVSWLQLLKFWS